MRCSLSPPPSIEAVSPATWSNPHVPPITLYRCPMAWLHWFLGSADSAFVRISSSFLSVHIKSRHKENNVTHTRPPLTFVFVIYLFNFWICRVRVFWAYDFNFVKLGVVWLLINCFVFVSLTFFKKNWYVWYPIEFSVFLNKRAFVLYNNDKLIINFSCSQR